MIHAGGKTFEIKSLTTPLCVKRGRRAGRGGGEEERESGECEVALAWLLLGATLSFRCHTNETQKLSRLKGDDAVASINECRPVSCVVSLAVINAITGLLLATLSFRSTRSSETFLAHFPLALLLFFFSFFLPFLSRGEKPRDPKGDESDECHYARRGTNRRRQKTRAPPGKDHLAAAVTSGSLDKSITKYETRRLFPFF